MRMGNIHEPQAAVDVTTKPIEGQTQTLRRHSDLITPLRSRTTDVASVDDNADVEDHDPDSAQVDDTTEHNNQHVNEHEESSYDADSNPCFDNISEDIPEDELEPRVDGITRATHTADELLTANGITSWILQQSPMYWRKSRMIAKHHQDRWTQHVSNWNQAISTKQ